MTCRLLAGEFAVCQLSRPDEADLESPILFYAHINGEISLVCPDEQIPASCLRAERHFRGFFVEGPLDFSLTGVMARLSSCLARAGIPLFAVSTYDTDYLFVRTHRLDDARRALEQEGIPLLPPSASTPLPHK